MTSSSFDVTDKVVVDVDVPFLVVVHRVFLTDLNLLDQPHERGTVKLLQIVVIPHHVQPCVYGLLILPTGGKLLVQFSSALLLCFRSEEHTSELQSRFDLVCLLLLAKQKVDLYMYPFTQQH